MTINRVNHVEMEVNHVGVTGVAILVDVGMGRAIKGVALGKVEVHRVVHRDICVGIKCPNTITTVIVVLLLWYWGQRRV